MPLISCPECSNQVADTAYKCQSCGVQLRKAKRGFFGKLFKWSFILFNVLMAWWLIAGMGAATKGLEGMSSAQQAGTAVGAGFGAILIIGLWVVGDIILGLFVLFTRPKT
jgi:hypothetical protein